MTCTKHFCHAFEKCPYKRVLAKCRICRQNELCSYWNDCIHRRDTVKCLKAGVDLSSAEDDLLDVTSP